MSNIYILVEKLEGKKPVGKPKHRQENNITSSLPLVLDPISSQKSI
jgi:hypothetical protein